MGLKTSVDELEGVMLDGAGPQMPAEGANSTTGGINLLQSLHVIIRSTKMPQRRHSLDWREGGKGSEREGYPRHPGNRPTLPPPSEDTVFILEGEKAEHVFCVGVELSRYVR